MDTLEISKDDLLLNTTGTAVSDYLLGFATLNPDLEVWSAGNVIVHKGLQQSDKVLIVSGGASGIEPAFAQFVGKGMLAASIQGDLLQSPASRPILQTIRELAAISMRGILIIVSGDSGPLLNFGLATERAKKDLLSVKMLPVFDTYSNAELSPTRRRGSSGIVFVIKIAGAMAEEGLLIDKIHDYCQAVIKNSRTISFAKNEQILRDHCFCKTNTEYLLGSNINGECPLMKLKKSHVMEVVHKLIEELLYSEKSQDFLRSRAIPVALLVNNVGGVTKLEEMIVVKELIGTLDEKGIIVSRLYSGTFLGSAYFVGFTISLLKIEQPDVLKYLDYPTTALGWRNITESRTDIKVVQKVPSILRKKLRDSSFPIKGPKLKDDSAMKIRTASNFACEAIISCERQLNRMDSEFGNCNTGLRMKTAAAMFLQKFKANKASFELPYHFFKYLSKLCEYHLGGALGCILCILFEAAAGTFISIDEIDDNLEGPIWLEALKNATETLKRYTLAKVGDNTLLDPLDACVQATVNNLFEQPTYLEAFGCGVAAAESISAKLKGKNQFPDPGSHAVVIILRALYEGLKHS